MPNPWLSLFISALTGGLMGAVINVLYQRTAARCNAKAKEQAAIHALAAELRRSRALCDYNANLRQDATGPLIQFPTATAQTVSFAERRHFPRLSRLQDDLVAYTMGLLQINQLIELHHLLWISPEQPSGVSPGAAGRRKQLRMRVADICAGQVRLEGVGPENFIVLPKYIDSLSARLKEVGG